MSLHDSARRDKHSNQSHNSDKAFTTYRWFKSPSIIKQYIESLVNPLIEIKHDRITDQYKVIAKDHIKKGDVILKEVPRYHLYGEQNNDPAIQIIIKMIYGRENELYPRNISDITKEQIKRCKIIRKYLDNKLQKQLKNIDDVTFTQYYLKYLYNAFTMYECGPVILILGARLNHSCDPNTEFYADHKSGMFIFKTTKNIKPGEEITDSYIPDPLEMKYENRQIYFEEHYGFVCNCDRCKTKS